MSRGRAQRSGSDAKRSDRQSCRFSPLTQGETGSGRRVATRWRERAEQKIAPMPNRHERRSSYAVPLSLITLRLIPGSALTRRRRDGISSVRGSGAHFGSLLDSAACSRRRRLSGTGGRAYFSLSQPSYTPLYYHSQGGVSNIFMPQKIFLYCS